MRTKLEPSKNCSLTISIPPRRKPKSIASAQIAAAMKEVHCLDAKTGAELWTHEAKGEFWASPLVADGKVYIGSRRGDFLVFAAGRDKKLLGVMELKDPIAATAVAANGTLYIG